ncbi:hypothetical protein D3C72_1998320 [compost metagenome]
MLPLSSYGQQTDLPFTVENIKAESLEVLDGGKKVVISEYNSSKKPTLFFSPNMKMENCQFDNIPCAPGLKLPL